MFRLKGERAGEEFCKSRRNGRLEQLTEVKVNFETCPSLNLFRRVTPRSWEVNILANP